MKKILVLSIALVALLGLFLTSKQGQIKTVSETSETKIDNRPENGTYEIVPNSFVVWMGQKAPALNYRNYGTLGIQKGSIVIEPTSVSGSIVFDMKDLKVTSTAKGTGEELLADHLKADDFFFVEKFPTAELRLLGTTQQASSTNKTAHIVTGDLTIKGVTNRIELPVNVYPSGTDVRIVATTTIDRTRWGITTSSANFFKNLGDKAIDDMIEISFNLLAQKRDTTSSEKIKAKEGSYVVTPNNVIHWEGRKTLIVNYKDTGTISIKEGSALVLGGKAEGSIMFDMTTLTAETTGKGSGQSGLTGHLKSADFFDVQKFPTGEFKITGIASTPNASSSFASVIAGTLTLKGITKPVQIPAEIYEKDGLVHVKASVELDRTQWDIRYNSSKFFSNLADNVIDDMFGISFHITASPKAQ